MTYTKEFRFLSRRDALCMVSFGKNRRSLQHLENLYQEARKDFPNLAREDVMVVFYDDQEQSRLVEIEFYCHPDLVPRGYKCRRDGREKT